MSSRFIRFIFKHVSTKDREESDGLLFAITFYSILAWVKRPELSELSITIKHFGSEKWKRDWSSSAMVIAVYCQSLKVKM